jgi:hypothetical protein
MATILSEKSESSFAPSHSFCDGTTFWRDTGHGVKFVVCRAEEAYHSRAEALAVTKMALSERSYAS